MNELIVVVPAGLRDTRGVELDRALLEHGARIVREQRRVSDGLDDGGYVELLVEDNSAPAHLRGQRVRPVWDRLPEGADGADDPGADLVLDRWEPASS